MGGRLIPHEPIFSDGPLSRLAREGSGIAATESLKGRRLRAAPPAVPTSTTAPQHRAAVQTACSLFEGPEGKPTSTKPESLNQAPPRASNSNLIRRRPSTKLSLHHHSFLRGLKQKPPPHPPHPQAEARATRPLPATCSYSRSPANAHEILPAAAPPPSQCASASRRRSPTPKDPNFPPAATVS